MKYGIVIRNVTDLRVAPKFQSERKSQLLFNEPVTITQKRTGYIRVCQDDGYNGWVDEKAVLIVGKDGWHKHKNSLNCRITAKTAVIRISAKPDSIVPPFLFYGTRLKVDRKAGNYSILESTPGVNFRIATGNIKPDKRTKSRENTIRSLIRDARRFVGVPYLWGGVIPFGFDCSGLVQAVYGMAGIILPRDSKNQRKAGRQIEKSDIYAGDLLFFPGHVAIALDWHRIIHASLAEGGVAINTLQPSRSGFRKDLYDAFVEARRVVL